MSKQVGVGSNLFGNAVVNKGLFNQNGNFIKAGWSTFQNTSGEWGYGFRIGIGTNNLNPNIANKHIFIQQTWLSNDVANPIIKNLIK